MALTPTTRSGFVNSGTTATTASFTPSNNCLLVAVVAENLSGRAGAVPTVTGGGLTWTKRLEIHSSTNDNSNLSQIWTAPVGTAASMTVSAAANGNVDGDIALAVIEFTGYDTGTPTGATHTFQTGSRSGVYNGALSATTAADSYVVGIGTTDSGTVTAGASWTSWANGAIGFVDPRAEYRSGALTTLDWAALNSSFSVSTCGLEIKAASAATKAIPLFRRRRMPWARHFRWRPSPHGGLIVPVRRPGIVWPGLVAGLGRDRPRKLLQIKQAIGA